MLAQEGQYQQEINNLTDENERIKNENETAIFKNR
jgi:hypothetical protein